MTNGSHESQNTVIGADWTVPHRRHSHHGHRQLRPLTRQTDHFPETTDEILIWLPKRSSGIASIGCAYLKIDSMRFGNDISHIAQGNLLNVRQIIDNYIETKFTLTSSGKVHFLQNIFLKHLENKPSALLCVLDTRNSKDAPWTPDGVRKVCFDLVKQRFMEEDQHRRPDLAAIVETRHHHRHHHHHGT